MASSGPGDASVTNSSLTTAPHRACQTPERMGKSVPLVVYDPVKGILVLVFSARSESGEGLGHITALFG